jgi:hypothetical protein
MTNKPGRPIAVNKKRKFVNVVVDQATYDAMKLISECQQVGMSELVRQEILQTIKRYRIPVL